MDLFSPIRVRPDLTKDQIGELEDLQSETRFEAAKESVLDELFPVTTQGLRSYQSVKSKTGTEYLVYPDGSLRRTDKLKERLL